MPKREFRPIKKGPAPIDYSQLKPRFKGKFNEQMKFCAKLVQELINSKKCKGFNWAFLEPVDVEGMKLYDYYDIIKEPMDLGTVKKKMDFKQYANPEEFRSDIELMCNNCFVYNPADQLVHKLGKNLMVSTLFYPNSLKKTGLLQQSMETFARRSSARIH